MDKTEIGYELMKVSNLVHREFARQVYKTTHDDNITGANMQILAFLNMNAHKEIYQKDIEKHFALRPSTVSANLRLMERKGLISREYSTIDTRLKRVTTTPKALELKEEMKLKTNELEEKFNSVLSIEEKATMIKLLRKMKSALE